MSKQQHRIDELDARALAKQDDFLNHIANRLGRARVTEAPQHPFRGAPDFWRSYELDQEQRIELFMKNWAGLGGVAQRFATQEQAAVFMEEVARELQAKYLIRWDHPMLRAMDLDQKFGAAGMEMTVWHPERAEELKAKAAGSDIGIAVVDHAVAHTGTVVALSGATSGRSVSLLPTAFMAVIPAHVIKTRMGEVMSALQAEFGHELPAGVHFISGPSRSADIENDLTIGVHGPGVVYALVVG